MRRNSLVDVAIAFGLLVVAAAVLIPRFQGPTCTGGNETAAIATLRILASVQREFMQDGLVDRDGDGVGEAGWIGELTGSAPLRLPGDHDFRGEPVLPARLSPSLANVDADGIVTRAGYAFRVFLPARDGGAVHEIGGETARGRPQFGGG